MNLAALLAEAKNILTAAKAGNATAEQLARMSSLKGEIAEAKSREADLVAMEGIISGVKNADQDAPKHQVARAKSAGAHFVAEAGDQLARLKSGQVRDVAATEYKAAGDPLTTGSLRDDQVDREVERQTRVIPTVASRMGSGTLTGTGITYTAEEAKQGSVTSVAEGTKGSKVTYAFKQYRDGISKVQGMTDLTEEMLDDLEYISGEVNGLLADDVEIEEERQILDGDGVGSNLLGLSRRTGVLAVASTDKADNASAIHRAKTQVNIASNRDADTVAIHPTDFEALRLEKDNEGRWIAGGPFASALGAQVWGMDAIVTTAATLGKPLVGAFATAKVYRKGGVAVAASSENGDNFETGKVTLKASKRLALQVKQPSAFAIVTLSSAAPAA
ncbi:phage major capsid protein [Glutamicibacter sp. NPDC087583]|uniref:phage major capsid protein n=1 Tax=Glutamicibacter sp. NPDC087583 TaxID=3363995 RepID=UPI00381BD1F7